MASYFVTRHAGAVDWARRRGIDATFVDHIDPAEVRAGDVVLGTLPVHLVAAVNARGARYLHLVLDLRPELRGKDLTAEDMDACGARLVEYRAEEVAG